MRGLRFSSLPYWDQNVNLEIASWMPYGIDFNPVSVNALYSERFASIARLAFGFGSEFFYLRSSGNGYVGTMARESLMYPDKNREDADGFRIVFSYSPSIERILESVARGQLNVYAGLTLCEIWDRSVLVDECKVVALASDDPLFDEDQFLNHLEQALKQSEEVKNSNLAFYAEKFGYRRFTIPYETDNVIQMEISQLLFEFELEETLEIVGPSPEVSLPSSDVNV